MSYQVNTKLELESFITKKWKQINKYLDAKGQNLPLPLYSSVDIRESINKFAPVDNNIYPAGFNNVCSLDLLICSEKFKSLISHKYPETKDIVIIPESHTKNLFYLDHLYTLQQTLLRAGFNVFIGSVDEELFSEQTTLELTSQSQWPIKIERIELKEKEFFIQGKKIDLAILNNDQSNPLPIDWKQLKTPVVPTPEIGWFRRQKVAHFSFYETVVNEFCKEFGVNPNLLQAKFTKVDGIDFVTKDGLEKLATETDSLLKDLPQGTPIFIKASQGTYGMGISVVYSGDEVLSMNRKKRNKMDIGKNKLKFTSILIQEGVETVIKYNDVPAEVTIYLINGESVGGFMRANPLKDSQSNLNSKGMVYQKYCISEIRENCDHKAKEAIYSTIARLSALASAYEIKEVL